MSNPHTIPIPAWVGISLILLTFGVVMGAMVIVKRRWKVHPEVPRKCAHVVMGLVSLPLPWLFDSIIPVVVLACLSLAALLLLRLAARRNCELGYILHWSVQRRQSAGDLLFPVSILTVFWFSEADPVLFCLPLLYLTFSDPAACFVGMRFRRVASIRERSRKTMEGSLAFFLMTFAMTVAGLTGFTNVETPIAILIALFTAAVLSVVEAASFRGLDNLTVPVFGYLLLSTARPIDPSPLVALASLSIFTTLVVLWWQYWTAYSIGPITTVGRFMAFVLSAPGGADRRSN